MEPLVDGDGQGAAARGSSSIQVDQSVIVVVEEDTVSEDEQVVEAVSEGEEDGVLKASYKNNVLESSALKISVEESKVVNNVPPEQAQAGNCKPENDCVVDVKCSNTGGVVVDCDNLDVEKVCRICHLSADRPSEDSELIQLGCGCKEDLGIVHRYCADAWFKLRGNSFCEICGEVAKNIAYVGDIAVSEEWNEGRLNDNNTSNINLPSERRGGLWRGQTFCNFIMACLVVAFVLPWFFRVSMF